MKFFIAILALAATAIAGESATICKNEESVVCKGNGGGVITLGNIANGALGEDCSTGEVYCCSNKDIKEVRSPSTQFLKMTN